MESIGSGKSIDLAKLTPEERVDYRGFPGVDLSANHEEEGLPEIL
jgi:hypothetical protein